MDSRPAARARSIGAPWGLNRAPRRLSSGPRSGGPPVLRQQLAHRARGGRARGTTAVTRPTRGFLGRRRDRNPRLPPGQYDVGSDWSLLTAEPTPRIAPDLVPLWEPGQTA